MAFKVTSLWQAPSINPVNHKAQSIPILNPFNVYGRVFLLSSWSFFVAFWSWYAFPPLLTVTIKKDLHLTQHQIANSNILALTATLLVRLSAGAACDRFGPRWTFATILLVGALPTALAGTVTSANGLIVLRLFIGVLGGTFVPCQVWTTGFFDKNVVGTANALAAGFGNAGSGVTYFLMPAIYDSLVGRQHLTAHTAWRVAFIVPFILIVATALVIIFACPDAPTGKWSSRAYDMQRQIEHRGMFIVLLTLVVQAAFDILGQEGILTWTMLPDIYVNTFDTQDRKINSRQGSRNPHKHSASDHSTELDYFPGRKQEEEQEETALNEQDLLNAASWELVEKPTYHGSIKALISLPTLTLIVAYFCTFGTELAVNSFLGAYYLKNFKHLGQTGSGRWAAMYGLLNAVFRPMGGLIADIVYRATSSLWSKKILMHSLAIIMGIFMLIVGTLDSHTKATMMGLMTGLAFFEEAGNGSVFALLPHVHPTSNGRQQHSA